MPMIHQPKKNGFASKIVGAVKTAAKKGRQIKAQIDKQRTAAEWRKQEMIERKQEALEHKLQTVKMKERVAKIEHSIVNKERKIRKLREQSRPSGFMGFSGFDPLSGNFIEPHQKTTQPRKGKKKSGKKKGSNRPRPQPQRQHNEYDIIDRFY